MILFRLLRIKNSF